MTVPVRAGGPEPMRRGLALGHHRPIRYVACRGGSRNHATILPHAHVCHDGVVPDSITIDLWSDVVCPFCYLGSRQLELALDRLGGLDRFVVTYHAFELDPLATASSTGLDEFVAAKYGVPLERARALNAQLSSQAADLGLTWSLEHARSTNTRDAHRLVALATTQGHGPAMARRLHRAYFSEGRLVSDHATLNALADDVGVVDAPALWRGDDHLDTVLADEATARELAITGVPTFVINRAEMVVGARGEQALHDAIERALGA